MAQLTSVTKKTINYNTTFGLLEVKRSASNYRYFDKTLVERIFWIEEQKNKGKSLIKIKESLFKKTSRRFHFLEIVLPI